MTIAILLAILVTLLCIAIGLNMHYESIVEQHDTKSLKKHSCQACGLETRDSNKFYDHRCVAVCPRCDCVMDCQCELCQERRRKSFKSDL